MDDYVLKNSRVVINVIKECSITLQIQIPGYGRPVDGDKHKLNEVSILPDYKTIKEGDRGAMKTLRTVNWKKINCKLYKHKSEVITEHGIYL